MTVSLAGLTSHVADVDRSLAFYRRLPGAAVLFHLPKVALEPTEAAAAACVEVANSPSFKVDRLGVPIHLPPAVAETLHVDLIGP
jgi:hypothetical protein